MKRLQLVLKKIDLVMKMMELYDVKQETKWTNLAKKANGLAKKYKKESEDAQEKLSSMSPLPGEGKNQHPG